MKRYGTSKNARVTLDAAKMARCLYSIAGSNMVLTQDMTYLATIFATRGTKIDKIINTTERETSEKLLALKKKYFIIDSYSGIPSAYVTLARIGKLWCHHICKCCYVGLLKDPVDNNDLPVGFPRAMRCSVYAGLIYRGMIKTDLKCLNEAYAYHQYLLECIISPRRSTPSEIMRRIEKQMNYSQCNEKMRLQFNIKFGILNGLGAIATEARPALEEAAQRWRKIIEDLNPKIPTLQTLCRHKMRKCYIHVPRCLFKNDDEYNTSLSDDLVYNLTHNYKEEWDLMFNIKSSDDSF